MIMKCIKKPVVVEAIQWTGDNVKEIEEFGALGNLDCLPVGGYIVKEADGKFYAYSNSAFHLIYERHLIWDENL